MTAVPAGSIVLVTGGAGFIGSHVCDALMDQGCEVRCFDNLATGSRANIAHLEGGPGFRFIEGDLCIREELEHAVHGVSHVVHLAALGSVPRSIARPLDSEAVNLSGFLLMLEVIRKAGVQRVVYASSSSVYGDSIASPKKEGLEGMLLSPYAVTKRMDEAYAHLYHRMFGTSVVGLRFFNVFGERQDPEGAYAAAIPRFILSFLRHQPPRLNGDGHQTRDFTYVGNAVRSVLCALGAPEEAAGQVFNIAYGASCDLLDLIVALRDRLVTVDAAIAHISPQHGPERPGDVRHSLADISKARKVLGYRPTFSLAEGLDRAVPWYAANFR